MNIRKNTKWFNDNEFELILYMKKEIGNIFGRKITNMMKIKLLNAFLNSLYFKKLNILIYEYYVRFIYCIKLLRKAILNFIIFKYFF